VSLSAHQSPSGLLSSALAGLSLLCVPVRQPWLAAAGETVWERGAGEAGEGKACTGAAALLARNGKHNSLTETLLAEPPPPLLAWLLWTQIPSFILRVVLQSGIYVRGEDGWRLAYHHVSAAGKRGEEREPRLYDGPLRPRLHGRHPRRALGRLSQP